MLTEGDQNQILTGLTEVRRQLVFFDPTLGRRKIAEIALKDMADLHHAMRSKPTQANRTLALLSKMFNLAERWGLRPQGANPCRWIDRYLEKRRELFLSSAEIARLRAVLNEEEAKDSLHRSRDPTAPFDGLPEKRSADPSLE